MIPFMISHNILFRTILILLSISKWVGVLLDRSVNQSVNPVMCLSSSFRQWTNRGLISVSISYLINYLFVELQISNITKSLQITFPIPKRILTMTVVITQLLTRIGKQPVRNPIDFHLAFV